MTYEDVEAMALFVASQEPDTQMALNSIALMLGRYRRQWGGPVTEAEIREIAYWAGMTFPLPEWAVAHAAAHGREVMAKRVAEESALN